MLPFVVQEFRRVSQRSNYHLSFFIFHLSLFTYHFSLIIFHFSLITYHFSLFTYHFSLNHFSLITYQRSSPLHPRRGERLQAGGGAQRNLCKLSACV